MKAFEENSEKSFPVRGGSVSKPIYYVGSGFRSKLDSYRLGRGIRILDIIGRRYKWSSPRHNTEHTYIHLTRFCHFFERFIVASSLQTRWNTLPYLKNLQALKASKNSINK